MPWSFLCDSYRAVLEDLLPDLQRKASLSITGYIRINDGGVDQSGKVGTDGGQMAAVCQPWEDKQETLKSLEQPLDFRKSVLTHSRRKRVR